MKFNQVQKLLKAQQKTEAKVLKGLDKRAEQIRKAMDKQKLNK